MSQSRAGLRCARLATHAIRRFASGISSERANPTAPIAPIPERKDQSDACKLRRIDARRRDARGAVLMAHVVLRERCSGRMSLVSNHIARALVAVRKKAAALMDAAAS